MSLEINADGTDPLAKLAALTALEACGYLADPRSAPAPVIAYAKGFSRAVIAIAKTLKTLRTADLGVIHNALSRIAREGLTPGDVGDKTSTAYLSPGKGGQISSEPNPRGRLAMARAAGIDVRAVAIHKGDKISLNGDGDIDTDRTTLDPDNRPTRWEHVKGVMIHLDDIHTGAHRSAWVSAAEIAERKAKADGQGAWNTDPISMACTKAIKIAIARGAIPQASLIPAILAACAAHPAPARPLAIEATPRQIAEAPPQPAPVPPTQPEPEPTPEPAPDGPIEVRLDACAATDPDAEPGPTIVDDVAGDLAADAECSRDHAEQAIDVAIEALRAAGKPHHNGALRAPPVWNRLIQRAAELARSEEAEAHNR
jgi:hypothetical protein